MNKPEESRVRAGEGEVKHRPRNPHYHVFRRRLSDGQVEILSQAFISWRKLAEAGYPVDEYGNKALTVDFARDARTAASRSGVTAGTGAARGMYGRPFHKRCHRGDCLPEMPKGGVKIYVEIPEEEMLRKFR